MNEEGDVRHTHWVYVNYLVIFDPLHSRSRSISRFDLARPIYQSTPSHLVHQHIHSLITVPGSHVHTCI